MSVPSTELWPPTPLPQASVPHLTKRGGGHTRLRVRGWGSPNSDDCRKKPSTLSTLWFYDRTKISRVTFTNTITGCTIIIIFLAEALMKERTKNVCTWASVFHQLGYGFSSLLTHGERSPFREGGLKEATLTASCRILFHPPSLLVRIDKSLPALLRRRKTKGSLTRDFQLLFFHKSGPLWPWILYKSHFKLLQKLANIFEYKGYSPVSLTTTIDWEN